MKSLKFGDDLIALLKREVEGVSDKIKKSMENSELLQTPR
jgi:hypothetical protein